MTSGLLLRLIEDVNVPAGLVCEGVSKSVLLSGGRHKAHTSSVRGVVTSPVIAEGADLGNLVCS